MGILRLSLWTRHPILNIGDTAEIASSWLSKKAL
jgi:hypothetical protein